MNILNSIDNSNNVGDATNIIADTVVDIGGDMLVAFTGLLIGMLFISLIIYICVSIFLNKYNKLKYGKGTFMAWVPVFQVYLTAKLAVNKVVAWILLGVGLLGLVLADPAGVAATAIYNLVNFILFIVCIVKYFKLKKEKKYNIEEAARCEKTLDATLDEAVVKMTENDNESY